MPSQKALYASRRTECVHFDAPWHGVDDFELATLNWVSWFNAVRLHSSLNYVPPAEFGAQHYRTINSQQQPLPGELALHQTQGDSVLQDRAMRAFRQGIRWERSKTGVSWQYEIGLVMKAEDSVDSLSSRARSFTARAKRRIHRLALDVRLKISHKANPASFDNYAGRISNGQSGGFPDHWRNLTDLPFSQPARIAVIMHVHFPDLVDDLITELESMPVPFDLLVTNSSGQELSLDLRRLGQLANHAVLDSDNHGRDIYPLVSLVNAGLVDPYDLVLKVHTKKSPWRADHPKLVGTGDQWRNQLTQNLLGGSDNITAILNAFVADPDLGVVGPSGSVLGPEYWAGNQKTASELMRRLELRLDQSTLRFPAGSSYWARGFVVQRLRALNLIAEDFEDEADQVNKTTAHAIERLIGSLAHEAGLAVVQREDLPS